MVGKAPHLADIKAEIEKRGSSLAQLAREHGCTRAALSLALRKPARMGEKIIAGFLGVHPSQLWPDRYDGAGARIVHVGAWRRRVNVNITKQPLAKRNRRRTSSAHTPKVVDAA